MDTLDWNDFLQKNLIGSPVFVNQKYLVFVNFAYCKQMLVENYISN